MPKTKGFGALVQRFLILVDDQFDADFARVAVAKLDHLGKFVTGVNVHQRKRDFAREKGLLRQAQHHRGIFSDGIQHHRPRELRRSFPENLNAFGLQSFQVVQGFCGHEPGLRMERSIRCRVADVL